MGQQIITSNNNNQFPVSQQPPVILYMALTDHITTIEGIVEAQIPPEARQLTLINLVIAILPPLLRTNFRIYTTVFPESQEMELKRITTTLLVPLQVAFFEPFSLPLENCP